MKMIPCNKCKKPMPEIRFTKYKYKVCVECSSTTPYRGVVSTYGEGDHTWNELTIMSENEYNKLAEAKNKLISQKPNF